jgi:hypothetical protein
MSSTPYVKKSDKEVLRNLNWDLSNLYFYIDYLNNSLDHYSNKKWLYNWTHSFRKKQIDEIRETIPEVYKHINEVKASIAQIKARMNKNIEDHINRNLYNNDNNEYYNTYYNSYNETSNEDDYEYNYNTYDDYDNDNDNYYVEENIKYNEIDNNEEGENEGEDYRYNPETGAFE